MRKVKKGSVVGAGLKAAFGRARETAKKNAVPGGTAAPAGQHVEALGQQAGNRPLWFGEAGVE